ncbi:hypothetical protein MTO96_028249 [Rhipicephalus appendiculatus]
MRTDWTRRIYQLEKKYGFSADASPTETAAKWAVEVRLRVREAEDTRWRKAMEAKSTLECYRKHKESICGSRCYDNGIGSSLLFEARAGALRTLESGTEEQYGELQQLLQEVSVLAREFHYEPRTRSKKGSRTASVGRQASRPSAAAEVRLAQQVRDAATDRLLQSSHEKQAENGRASENHSPTALLLGMIGDEEPQPPVEGSGDTAVQVDNTQDDATVQEPDDGEAFVPQRQQAVQGVQQRRITPAVPRDEKTINFLYEKRSFNWQKKLELEERRLKLDEEKHRFEVEKVGSG